MATLPVDWNGNKLECGFYEARDGKLVYIEQQEGEFTLSVFGEDGTRPLVCLDGQHIQYLKVDPVKYLARKEEELSKLAKFVQEHIE